jgi:hypothetical protein
MLVTVSHSGLGARRTLIRSSVERGMVIMVVQPSSNSTHSSPNIILEGHPYSNTFRKNPNRFRLDDDAFKLLGVRRSRWCLSKMEGGSGAPAHRKRQRRRMSARSDYPVTIRALAVKRDGIKGLK